jgi:hypothetical protein
LPVTARSRRTSATGASRNARPGSASTRGSEKTETESSKVSRCLRCGSWISISTGPTASASALVSPARLNVISVSPSGRKSSTVACPAGRFGCTAMRSQPTTPESGEEKL